MYSFIISSIHSRSLTNSHIWTLTNTSFWACLKAIHLFILFRTSILLILWRLANLRIINLLPKFWSNSTLSGVSPGVPKNVFDSFTSLQWKIIECERARESFNLLPQINFGKTKSNQAIVFLMVSITSIKRIFLSE